MIFSISICCLDLDNIGSVPGYLTSCYRITLELPKPVLILMFVRQSQLDNHFRAIQWMFRTSVAVECRSAVTRTHSIEHHSWFRFGIFDRERVKDGLADRVNDYTRRRKAAGSREAQRGTSRRNVDNSRISRSFFHQRQECRHHKSNVSNVCVENLSIAL